MQAIGAIGRVKNADMISESPWVIKAMARKEPSNTQGLAKTNGFQKNEDEDYKISKDFELFVKNWEKSEEETQRRVKRLAPENRELIELQMKVSHLQLQVNLASQISEAFNSAVKRLFQMAGN